MRPTLTRHSIECIASSAELMVEGDRLRLEQVFQNLLQNAIKYSPLGGPITVRVKQQDRLSCVSVQDSGIGIPPEALPKLFQHFYRAPNVADVQGMGIGLYVVKEIVTLHGGTLEVESTEGVGSTFTICIPQSA